MLERHLWEAVRAQTALRTRITRASQGTSRTTVRDIRREQTDKLAQPSLYFSVSQR